MHSTEEYCMSQIWMLISQENAHMDQGSGAGVLRLSRAQKTIISRRRKGPLSGVAASGDRIALRRCNVGSENFGFFKWPGKLSRDSKVLNPLYVYHDKNWIFENFRRYTVQILPGLDL